MASQNTLPDDIIELIRQSVQLDYEAEQVLTRPGKQEDNLLIWREMGNASEERMDQVGEYCQEHGIDPQVAWNTKDSMRGQIDPHREFKHFEVSPILAIG